MLATTRPRGPPGCPPHVRGVSTGTPSPSNSTCRAAASATSSAGSTPPRARWSSRRPSRLRPATRPGVRLGRSGLVIVRRAGGSEGETISARPERRATILVDAEEPCRVLDDAGRARRGGVTARPPLRESKMFGMPCLEARERQGRRRALEGRRAHGEAHVVFHAAALVHEPFDNDGSANARCCLRMPSSGFADYARERQSRVRPARPGRRTPRRPASATPCVLGRLRSS